MSFFDEKQSSFALWLKILFSQSAFLGKNLFFLQKCCLLIKHTPFDQKCIFNKNWHFVVKFRLNANQLSFWFCFVRALGVSLSKVAVRPNELWVGYRTYRLVPDQISISTQSNLYTSNLSLFNPIRICPCPYMNTTTDEVSKEIWFLEPNSHNPNIDQKVISIEKK